MDSRPPTSTHDRVVCVDCPLDERRREFVLGMAAAAAAALAGLGALPTAALAHPVEMIGPATQAGDTRSYPIPTADGVAIDRGSEVILARWQGYVYAFSLACPHQNTALRWSERDGRFQCPRHKSKYSPDGSFISGRATRGMDRFAVRREEAMVVVDLGDLRRESDDRAAWAAAALRV